MGLLDRWLNPLWYRIEQLDDVRKADVCLVICMNRFWRLAMDDKLVKPFERLCGAAPTAALRREDQKIVPLAQTTRERLIDEALLACLSACRRSSSHQTTVLSFEPSLLPDAVGCIALAEINSRLGREKPDVLEGAGYSRDHDEARTQVLLSWMKILQLSDASFVGVVAAGSFGKEWAICIEGLLGGSLKIVERGTPAALRTRARADLSALSPRARTVIDYFIRRV